MRVQHNIMAMNAYRNYNNNTKALSKNLEKLSSGYKINRAGDNAAGLAISEKMRAQITGLATAQANAKDGISLIQTAEGALTEVHSMLNRMYELAEQSANGTYDNEVDRANLQKEFDALRTEIDRIADSSNFNGQKLLNGELEIKGSRASISGAADLGILPTSTNLAHITNTVPSQKADEPKGSSFALELGNMSLTAAADLTLEIGGMAVSDANGAIKIKVAGTSADDVQAAVKTALDGKEVTLTDSAGKKFTLTAKVDGTKVSFEQSLDDVETNGAFTVNQKVEFKDGSINGTIPTTWTQGTIENVQGVAAGSNALANTEFELTSALIKDGGVVTIGGHNYVFALGANSKFKDVSGDNVTAIDLTAFEDATDAKALAKAGELLSQQDNEVFHIGYNATTKKVVLQEKDGQTAADLTTHAKVQEQVRSGSAKFMAGSGKGLQLQIGDTSESFNQLVVSVNDMHASALGIGKDTVNINKQGLAQSAMDAIKAAINSVSSTRGDLGAMQNRLEHTISNLSVMQENIQDAESTIRDTDVAAEMMEYTKNNILIQASQSMLAQANQIPQGVLQLMG